MVSFMRLSQPVSCVIRVFGDDEKETLDPESERSKMVVQCLVLVVVLCDVNIILLISLPSFIPFFSFSFLFFFTIRIQFKDFPSSARIESFYFSFLFFFH